MGSRWSQELVGEITCEKQKKYAAKLGSSSDGKTWPIFPRMLYGLLGISMLISTARPDNPLQKKFPTAIIVGVKKAGTRALLEFLRLNPRIRAPGPEVHFFDKNYHRGLEWYR
ncbi:hypothetical protein ANCCEY_09082 [Ancylostoma ceylanicum]|uniref:Sulfotransferase domain-containing protein n=1 Tax=Ancylostoma ceylanicum TaxID=53326 RepID=A0A0D6LIK0_9BILA|nr:hypothetical protein ANCCEY_09082 [Ancylostoma ceylanicum]